MDLGVRAQESSLKNIFGPSERLCMPPYQRSYSWTEREAGELLTDLPDAAETGTPHFVGAVVLNRGEEEGLLEIVDGQQRLTTPTILLSVLRDIETEPSKSAEIHALIADEARPMLGEAASWRLQLLPDGLQTRQPRLPVARRKRRTIASEATFLQRESQQVQPVPYP